MKAEDKIMDFLVESKLTAKEAQECLNAVSGKINDGLFSGMHERESMPLADLLAQFGS